MASRSSKPKGRRGNITAEAREKGALAKIRRGVFNRYIRSLSGRAVERNQEKIREIDETLESGVRRKKAPVFEGGKRVGTTTKDLPLLPSERATLMVRRKKLVESLGRRSDVGLRVEFLAMLPEYASDNEFTREILLASGVPEADLDEVGIAE